MPPGALFFSPPAGLFLAAALGQAAAQPLPIAFDVFRLPGAERCPDRDALTLLLAKRLLATGGPPRVPIADRITITIEQTHEGYVGTLSSLGLEGSMRRFLDAGADCAGLTEALTLTLLMIADGPPPTPVKPKEVPQAAPAARAWELGASVVGSTGILGAPSLGVALELVSHPWPRLATGLSALWMPSRTLETSEGATRFMLVGGIARVCWGILPFDGRAFPAVCGEAGAGGLRGEGERYEGSRSVWVSWFAAGGSLDFGLRVHPRLILIARMGYLFSLKSDLFTVGGLGTIYDSGHPGWTSGFGALVTLP